MNKKSWDLFEDSRLSIIKYPPIVIAEKIKNPINMGQIIRIAANLGSSKVYFIDEEIFVNPKNIKKTAVNALNFVDFEFISLDKLNDILPKQYKLVALETTNQAVNIFNSKLPKKMAIVIGSEKNGVSDDLLKLCKNHYYIPNPGKCSSLNVSHALSIGLYEWLRQTYY